MPTVNVVTLGCSKNLVDSERLLKMLKDVGAEVVNDSDEPTDIAIINTCGFISDAKEESVNTILRFAQAREKGEIGRLYVMGCLSQRYREELRKEIPEVDEWFGKFDWPKIATEIAREHPATAPYDRLITTGPRHAYLKIAEGCNRFCSFCAIPLITGRFRSRPVEELVAETRLLAARGVAELNIIAQDLSSYGTDLPDHPTLGQLVDALSEVEGIRWIRMHYAYPAQFPMEMLDVMARNPKVCKYLDIALQHIDDTVLGNMRRHITAQQTRELLAEIRRRVPGIHIRTTLMVGFPGETDEAFERLLDFVREQRFERMGAFSYSEEEGTYGEKHFSDDIPAEVKQRRLDRLMEAQEEISLEIQQQKVGRSLEVVIDREQADYYVGRSQYDSPEVDPEVLVKKTRKLGLGEFVNVRVVEALPFELIAELC